MNDVEWFDRVRFYSALPILHYSLSIKSIVRYSLYTIFALSKTVIVAQSVRAPDCGSGGRGFEPRLSPFTKALIRRGFFYVCPSTLG